MKVAIVGAGFTGLSVAYKLTKEKITVDIFEKEKSLGGLASSFSLPNWQNPLEKHYHHWFTNDSHALDLIKELGLEQDLIFPKTTTSIYYQGNSYPFNSPLDLLNFHPLKLSSRVRTGVILLYLKILPKVWAIELEKFTAYYWLEKWFGKQSFEILWQPLLLGKFGALASKINMAWFWARIKKRTMRLGYLHGGYQKLIDSMAHEINQNGGKFFLSTSFDSNHVSKYDKVIVTAPTDYFLNTFRNLPVEYKRRLSQIPHLHALNFVMITKKKFLDRVYWLNINENNFPFIGVIQQTNMIDCSSYGNQHITWVANYLPPNHPYLKMTPDMLYKTYLPFLKKINKDFDFQGSIINCYTFLGKFAQPVFPVHYSRVKPDFITPFDNVYLANMDMVYPWDRGTNYAIELGYEVAKMVTRES